MTFKIGDTVRLTGKSWPQKHRVVPRGSEHVIIRVSGEHAYFRTAEMDWSVDKADWAAELVEPVPEPEPEVSSEEGPLVKFAMELSGVDIGTTIEWVHEYRYQGEDRAKVKSAKKVTLINQQKTKVTLHHTVKKRDYYNRVRDYQESVSLNLNQKVIVYR